MANEFFADPAPFSGRMHASFGGLALILRNSVVDRVITPGKRFSRAWRAPLTGDLQFIEVYTGDRRFGLGYDDLATADGFHIRLQLDAVVRINDAGGYQYLERFVQQHGADFDTAILQELDNGLKSVLARTVHDYNHSDLRLRGADSVKLGRLPVAFGNQVLQLVSYSVTGIVWDEIALEAERIEKSKAVNKAQAENDQARLNDREVLLRPIAERLGLPVTLLLDKELHGEQERAALDRSRLAIEAFQALPESVQRQMVREDPTIVYQLMGNAAPAAFAGREITGHNASPTHTARQLPAGSEEDAPTEVIVDAIPLDGLNKTAKLARLWSRRSPEPLDGIAGAVGEERATVLVVTAVGDVPTGFEQDVAGFYGKPVDVRILPPGGLDVLVTSWFRHAAPTAEDTSPRATLTEDDVVRIDIVGPAMSARAVTKHLNRPGNTDTEALDDLLPAGGLLINADGR